VSAAESAQALCGVMLGGPSIHPSATANRDKTSSVREPIQNAATDERAEMGNNRRTRESLLMLNIC